MRTKPRHTDWTGVALGLVLASYAAFQQFKLPPALPLMLEAYGYDRTLAGGFMSVYAAAGLFLSLALGRHMERRGPVSAVLVALALMLAGTLATLALPQFGWLVLAARTLEGVAFAVLAIAGPVLANANAGRDHLPLVIALTAAWIPIGQLSAIVLAQPGFALLGWQSLWWIALVLTVALALWVGALARRGHAAVLAGQAHKPVGDAGEAAPATVSGAQRLSLGLAGSVFMLWSGQYFAYMTWLPQYLVEALGFSLGGALFGYTLPVSVLLVAILITGQALNRGVALGGLLVGGLAAQTLSWAMLPLAGDGLLGIAALIVYGAAAGVVPTCLFAMPSAIAGHGRTAATAFGIIMTGRNLGVLIGPVMLAQVFAVTGGWTWSAPILGGVTAVALVLGVWLSRRIAGTTYGTSR